MASQYSSAVVQILAWGCFVKGELMGGGWGVLGCLAVLGCHASSEAGGLVGYCAGLNRLLGLKWA